MGWSQSYLSLVILLWAIGTTIAQELPSKPLGDAEIGRHVFLDTTLSNPVGQGCVSCHQARHAFADPKPVSKGAVQNRVGTRNAPSLMYAALIPNFAYEDFLTPDGQEIYAWEGGLFHDGRARDLFEQVQQPFFHANEMNLSDESELARKLRRSNYAKQIRSRFGEEAWQQDEKLVFHVYLSLVAFLREPIFRPFDARIDDFLAGKTSALTAAEQRGLEVFRGAGKCADCHLLEPTTWDTPLLSDFGYDNLGVPSRGGKDAGLGRHTKESGELGQFRAPSLRNVALTAPYMHNGSIMSLREVVEFYNRRDVEPKRWGKTDYPQTVNRDDMGDLKLSDQQVNDLIALMDAFTDRTLLEMIEKRQSFPKAPADTPSTKSKLLLFPGWTHRLHPMFPK